MLRQKEIEKTELATYSVKVAETCYFFYYYYYYYGREELKEWNLGN